MQRSFRLAALALLGVLLHLHLHAQQWGCIEFMVLDADTKEMLPFVTIVEVNASHGVFTDLDGKGKLCFDGQPDSIVVNHIGYERAALGNLKPGSLMIELLPLKLCCDPPIPVVFLRDYVSDAQGWRRLPQQTSRTAGGITPADELNLEPGVQLDERGAGGSRRLSIRGSQVRSPFGMRNIRTYLDGIPITSPDGTTPAEYLDLDVYQGPISLIKGPPGAQYGPSTAGLLSLRTTDWSPPDRHTRAGFTADATQRLLRWNLSVARSARNHPLKPRVSVSYAGQTAGGYRQQEANSRHLLLATASMQNRRASRFLTFTALGFQGQWQLPGALNVAERDTAPQSALPYSVAMNAHVRKSSLLLALKHEQLLNDRWRMTQVAYFNYSDKENPYGTSPFNQGYKQERTPGAGLRAFIKRTQEVWLAHYLSFTLGGEFQWEGNRYREHVNDSGRVGHLKWDMQQQSLQGFGFAAVSLNQGLRWGLSAEASVNTTGYQLEDHPAGPLSPNLSGRISYAPQLQHALAGEYALLKRILVAKARVSRGFSQPSLWETFLPSGELLVNLKPESNLQSELGMTLYFDHRRMMHSFNAYQARLHNMIVPQTDTAGLTRYVNAGLTHQQGIEYIFTWDKSHHAQLWFVQLAAGLQDYRYVTHGSNDAFDGNQMPGVARLTTSALMEYGRNRNMTRLPWTLRANARYQSGVLLNDANAAEAAPFLLLGISGSLMLKRNAVRFPFWLEGGVTNLLDEKWNSFLNLNAANARYFNPGPGRSFWLGLRFQPYTYSHFPEPRID